MDTIYIHGGVIMLVENSNNDTRKHMRWCTYVVLDVTYAP